MAAGAHMSHEVVPDALPYIDQGYDEAAVREMVNLLIEEETRRYRPTKNYLDFLPQPNYNAFETTVMKTEFERISNRQPMEVLSMKRYELPHPTAAQKTDISAWTECVNNSMAQLEHQATRILNLELLSKFGAESWRSHNATLQQMFSQQQKVVADLRKKIQEINWERKMEQTKAGEELQLLESRWIELVSKNYEIERACIELESEIAIRKQKQRLEMPQQARKEVGVIKDEHEKRKVEASHDEQKETEEEPLEESREEQDEEPMDEEDDSS